MAIINSWKIDPTHSKIAFKVGYMQLGTITGEFRVFDGVVECDEDFDAVRLEVAVESRSVTTFHALRDEGIRGVDVLNTASFPLILFTSTDFRRVSSGGLFDLSGLLAIRGNTAPIQAMVSLIALTTEAAVFTFSGTLSRGAFGLGGPGTNEQESVDDVVEFLGEMCVCRD